MKKAQILSVIALAFALGLGVVAPVANTYAAEIQTRDYATDESEATKQDVTNTIDSIKKDSKYAAYATLDKDLANAPASDIATTGLTTALSNLEITTTSTGNVYQQVKALVAVAEGVANYDEWENLVTRVAEAEGLSASATDAQKDAAQANLVAAINGVPGVAKYTLDEDETLATTITNAKNAVIKDSDNKNTVYTFSNMKALIAAVDTQSTAVKSIDTLQGDLNAIANFMPTSTAAERAAKEAFTKSVTDAVASSTPLTTLKTIAGGYVTSGANATDYLALKALVDAGVTSDPYDEQIEGLEEAFEDFAGYELKNSTPATPSTPATTNTATATAAGVTVTATGAFPAGTEIKIVKSDNKVAAFGDRKYGMWDIVLVDAKGNTVSFEGNITVTITVPEGIDGAKAGVYFVDAQGNVQRYASTFADGKMTFTTNHFSLWAIVEDNGEVLDTPESPDTGIIASAEGSASTTVAMVAGLATALTAAGAGVVAYRNARRSTRK